MMLMMMMMIMMMMMMMMLMMIASAMKGKLLYFFPEAYCTSLRTAATMAATTARIDLSH